MAEQAEKVRTNELRTGDLVLHYGMRIRLGERHEYTNDVGSAAWWFPGTVENMSEVYRPDHVTAGLLHEDAQWTIQGNELASWWRLTA